LFPSWLVRSASVSAVLFLSAWLCLRKSGLIRHMRITKSCTFHILTQDYKVADICWLWTKKAERFCRLIFRGVRRVSSLLCTYEFFEKRLISAQSSYQASSDFSLASYTQYIEGAEVAMFLVLRRYFSAEMHVREPSSLVRGVSASFLLCRFWWPPEKWIGCATKTPQTHFLK